MEFYNNFLDFLNTLGADGFKYFTCIIIGICIASYICAWLLPRTLIDLVYEIIVLLGFKNDIWKDKLMWDTTTYIYRKIENLYDEYGFCTKGLFYKIKLKNFHKRSCK